MDIVDAQVHVNVLGTEVTLAIMDALGIQGVLFDEYLTAADDGALHPGYRLPNGAFRSVGPNAEAAALRHPDRFAFLMRVDPLDPGIEGWIETLATAPGFKALRTSSQSVTDVAVALGPRVPSTSLICSCQPIVGLRGSFAVKAVFADEGAVGFAQDLDVFL